MKVIVKVIFIAAVLAGFATAQEMKAKADSAKINPAKTAVNTEKKTPTPMPAAVKKEAAKAIQDPKVIKVETSKQKPTEAKADTSKQSTQPVTNAAKADAAIKMPVQASNAVKPDSATRKPAPSAAQPDITGEKIPQSTGTSDTAKKTSAQKAAKTEPAPKSRAKTEPAKKVSEPTQTSVENKVIWGYVISADAAKNQVLIKSKRGKETTLSLAAETTIDKGGHKKPIKITDLMADDYLAVTLSGGSVANIHVNVPMSKTVKPDSGAAN